MTKRGDTQKSMAWALLAVAPFLILTACGGGTGSAPPASPHAVSVTITPPSASVSAGGLQRFAAAVAGTSNAAVTWSVAETNGGTIDANGNYTAPMKAGSFHVIATSQAIPSASATVPLSVSAPAPVFNSTPPTASAQDTLYSYTISATDPAGGAVTFSLTSAPEGAALNGTTLTWTP